MLLLRRSNSILLIIALGLGGCATPPPVPQAISPADIVKAIPQGNNTTVVNVVPPARQHQTLPDFLGITRCCYAAIDCCNYTRIQAANCFPGLAGVIEPGAGVLTPEEAANASPAVKTAAEIKAQEDQAAAKIAALRYLATIGCSRCYEGVEEAFIAALDDCTEEVRFEAVLAIRQTMCGGCKCSTCNKDACCSEKLQKKLREKAYETDDDGCPKEPSERVRRKARLVLRGCGPAMVEPTPPAEQQAPPEDIEGPSAGAQPAAGTPSVPPPAGAPAAPSGAAAPSAEGTAAPPPIPPQDGAK